MHSISHEGIHKIYKDIYFSFSELKSISRALLVTNEQIPEQRKNDLRARLKVLCPDVEEYSEDFLKSNLNIETT